MYISKDEMAEEVVTGLRICSKCEEDQPLEAFDKNKACHLGRTRTCTKCNMKYRRAWYQKHKVRKGVQGRINRRKVKEEIVEMLGGRCMDCDGVFPQCAFDFHHRDPTQKDFSIGQQMSSRKAKEEAKKCDLLCANCHRIRHFEEDA